MGILNRSQQKEWDKAHCPICGQEYSFIANIYKPVTCGRFTCLQEAIKRGILPK